MQVGDVVVLYGRRAMLDDVAVRLHGDEGHQASERARRWHAATPAEEPPIAGLGVRPDEPDR